MIVDGVILRLPVGRLYENSSAFRKQSYFLIFVLFCGVFLTSSQPET